MERYVGLDVHAASCTLAVISEKGRKHLVFEAGLQSAWLYEILRPHVDEIVVAGISESRGPKSDKRDAYGLADDSRVGNLGKSVFKAPREFPRLRELSRTHTTLVGDVVRAQSRIKSLYRSRGVRVSGENVYGMRHREAWQQQLPSSAQARATRLYAHLDFLRAQKDEAAADLLREAMEGPPGSPVWALPRSFQERGGRGRLTRLEVAGRKAAPVRGPLGS